jgi:hypothetical protein
MTDPIVLIPEWDAVVAQIMRRLDLGTLEGVTPNNASTKINTALDVFSNAINEANHMIQSLAVRDGIIKEQSNILDAFAMILHLPSGSKYIDMVPMLQALVDTPTDPVQ